jgi:hypothetical protein
MSAIALMACHQNRVTRLCTRMHIRLQSWDLILILPKILVIAEMHIRLQSWDLILIIPKILVVIAVCGS